jgi:hypothetical protein
MYEGNVKNEQVEALQRKVEVLGKKIATLLQLLPQLGENFGVSMKQMTDHVMLFCSPVRSGFPQMTTPPIPRPPTIPSILQVQANAASDT